MDINSNEKTIGLLCVVIAILFANRAIAEEQSVLTVSGSFEVKLEPQEDSVSVGRMGIDKQYEGELSGTGKGQMLSHREPDAGSAVYVALEHFDGELSGKEGGFSLYHVGTMKGSDSSLTVNIIDDSGYGELEGISGHMSIDVREDGHFYTLTYRMD